MMKGQLWLFYVLIRTSAVWFWRARDIAQNMLHWFFLEIVAAYFAYCLTVPKSMRVSPYSHRRALPLGNQNKLIRFTRYGSKKESYH